ncbi:MAG TPA: hypothetical protein VEI03_05685 [Stellaceae bacterium]|nr:hypothetical protein [Stellaceae bacterium]
MIGPDVLLRIYSDQYFHHDRLIWGQLQTLIALQGAILVGGFATQGSRLSVCIIIAGLVFLAILYLYVERVKACRDANMKAADKLIEKYADHEVQKIIGVNSQGHRLRFYAQLPPGKWFIWKMEDLRPLVSGYALLVAIFVLLFAIDVIALARFSPWWPR